jgi:hypothetical protein
MMARLREPRIAVWILVFVGVVLRLPSIWVGFGMDDFAQLAMLGGVYPAERAPWDLFTFSDGSRAEVQRLMDRGSLAWWSDPSLRLSALRPLSSLLTWLDVQVFGHRAALHHVHTLVWWAVMALVISRLLLRLLPARWAVLAFALYVLDECHTYPIGWLANRNAIVSATFGFAAVLAHVRWREDGRRGQAWLAALCLALALAGGEYGLCAVAYVGAYELAGVARSNRTWRAWVPLVCVLVVWAVVHRAFGYGSQGSTVYVDPLREPGAWVQAALVRVPILVADMLLAIPTGKLAFFPDLMRMQALLGPLALAVVGGLVPGALKRLPVDQRRRLAFACLAAFLSLLPVASSFVSARLLLIPGVAGHVVVAALVLDGWDAARDPERRRGWIGRLRILAGAALACTHVGLATYWGLEETISIGELNRGTRTASLSMQVDDATVADQRLIVLTAADPMTLLYPPTVRWVEGLPLPRSWWVLSMAPRPHRMRRTAANQFELEVVDGAMLKGPVEQLFRRPDHPFAVGDTVALDGLRIEILGLDDEARPIRARYTFDRRLEHPSLVFLLATRRGMIRYPMGPVGATVTVPPAALPLSIPVEGRP